MFCFQKFLIINKNMTQFQKISQKTPNSVKLEKKAKISQKFNEIRRKNENENDFFEILEINFLFILKNFWCFVVLIDRGKFFYQILSVLCYFMLINYFMLHIKIILSY